MKTKSNKSIEMLINEVLLLEAKETAEFLIKLNYDAIKAKNIQGITPRDIYEYAREGPRYSRHVINFVNGLERPGGYERPFIKWLGDNLILDLSNSRTINYIYDWYLGDQNAKNILNTINFIDAEIAAETWHESLKKKNFDTDIASEGKTKVVYAFPNGSKIVELSWEDCDAEGTSMGHCVGTNHTDLVKNNQEKIFSLRSETNKPHVTISVDPNTNEVLEIKGRENKVPVEKHAKLVKEWLKTTNFNYIECYDYFSMFSLNEKKEILKKIKESDVERFINLVCNILGDELLLTKQELTKIALGAAMNCKYDDTIFELLSITRDWTNGKVSDKQAQIAHYKIRQKVRNSEHYNDNTSAVEASGAGLQDTWYASESVLSAIKLSCGSYKEILNSIEKEIGAPLEDFLFKNENQEVNESLIKDFINLYS